jgi:hypothetical protein
MPSTPEDPLQPTPLAVDSVATPAANGSQPEDTQPAAPRRTKRWWQMMPAWLVSMMLHVAALLVLAAMTIEPIQQAISTLMVSGGAPEAPTELKEFDIAPADDSTALSKEETEFVPESLPVPQEQLTEVVSNVSLDSSMTAQLQVELPSLTQQLTPSDMLSASSRSLSKSLSSRSSAARAELLDRFGGTKDTEKAVANALKWLAEHQLPDGSWTFAHAAACRGKCDHPGSLIRARNAATGLALLPFLGAGQTHLEGEYKQVVYGGLKFLLDSMKVERGELPTGSWHGGGDNMYGHGIASIAMCEAYGMTRDESLAIPAQLAVNFIASSQDPNGGGWRYAPRQAGDTSAVGWQLMALKSGAAGGLAIQPVTLRKADAFLNFIQTNNGAYYGYDEPSSDIEGRKATTACGLLCRMYMGWPKDHPGLKAGIEFLAQKGPDPVNMYFNYYATQVLKQYGGEYWEPWNQKMRDQLVATQESKGHSLGSWVLEDRSAGDPLGAGGRLYVTCMATMILEVYYRYMPIYGDQTEEEAFKL